MWKLREKDKDKEQALIKLGQDKLTARLIAQRNKIDIATASNFIATEYKDMSHPHTLNGIKEASEMFCHAVKNKEDIAVFGDYDCDGIFSSVMIHELCKNLDHKCKVFLPSRLEHGYGLSKKGIEAFKEFVKDPPDLFIAVDCGSNNDNEVIALKEWGVKRVIIIDHHLVEESTKSKSADILINWHLSQDTEEMCACGEVFQLIRGIRWLTKKVNPLEYLTYAAIGTIADVSPIKSDNRIIVKYGLNEFALSHVIASGLHALVNNCYIKNKSLTTEDVAFKIAPRINACGRISTPLIAYELLIERNMVTADLRAEELNDLNKERKTMQRGIALGASQMVKDNPELYKSGIMVWNPKWHIGTVGIVASRLVEEFKVPAVVIGKQGDLFKGSGRSLGNINLKHILDDCKDLFESYGGHALAAGVTLKPDSLDKANSLFNNACKKYFKSNVFPNEDMYYDATLKIGSVSMELAERLLNSMYPYCRQSNPEPIFRLSDVKIDETDIKEGDGWTLVKIYIEKDGVRMPYMLKTFSTKFGSEINGQTADVYFSFPQNFDIDKPQAFQLNLIDIDLK